MKELIKKKLKKHPNIVWHARWLILIFNTVFSSMNTVLNVIIRRFSPSGTNYTAKYNSNTVLMNIAKLKQHKADKLLGESIDLCKKAHANSPNSFDTNANLAVAYLSKGRPIEAWSYAIKALKISPREKWLWEFLYHIKAKHYGLLPALLEIYDQGRVKHPTVDFFREDGFFDKKQEAVSRGIPSIFVNTQPKSGTIYIRGKLSQGLGIPWCRLTVNPVDNEPIQSWVNSLAGGGAVSGEHLFPTETTINRLKTGGIDKIVIHSRDPRETAFSMIHFRKKQSMYSSLAYDSLGNPHGDLPIDDRFLIECNRMVPRWCGWLESWLKLEKQGNSPFSLLFTEYRDFLADEEAFIKRILEFYEIDLDKFDFGMNLSDSHKAHFRSGKQEEWRGIISDKVRNQVWSLMDKRLSEQFDWEK